MLTLSVAQLNDHVHDLIARDPLMQLFKLRGEISGFKRHSSGHLYFSLKDEGAVVRCVMFRQNAMRFASLRIADGMRVVLTGSASLYTRDGSFQFYATAIELDGVGALYQAFEALKRKLDAEGLFDELRKRELPSLPRAVGVVTSPTGAALRDIVRIAHGRHPGIPIVVSPALVQGEGAGQSIADALERLARRDDIDVVIVGRGGGSIEDLWAFNEEVVARAIADCPVPVISAVGHETDFTIADFVADVRAATPSHAAQAAFPDRDALLAASRALRDRMARALERSNEWRRTDLSRLSAQLRLLHPLAETKRARELTRSLRERMSRSLRDALNEARMRSAVSERLTREMHDALREARRHNDAARARLEALSPYRVLQRGFAMIERDGDIVSSVRDVRVGDALSLLLSDGALAASVQRIDIREEASS